VGFSKGYDIRNVLSNVMRANYVCLYLRRLFDGGSIGFNRAARWEGVRIKYHWPLTRETL
jgi:hypothetical protein